MNCQKQHLPRPHAKADLNCPGRRAPGRTVSRLRRRHPRPPPIFFISSAEAARNPTGSRCPLNRSRRRMPIIGRKTRPRELRVPIGRSGATKLQYLAIGKATRQHGLLPARLVGQIHPVSRHHHQSGVVGAAPNRLNFILWTSRKAWNSSATRNRRLPHARVVAIESDRAFGLSVLQRVDDGTAPPRRFVPQAGRAGSGRLQAGGRDRTVAPVAVDHRRISGIFRGGRPRFPGRGGFAGPHHPAGPRVWHTRAARLADPGRRLHPGPGHHRPDGHPHCAAV